MGGILITYCKSPLFFSSRNISLYNIPLPDSNSSFTAYLSSSQTGLMSGPLPLFTHSQGASERICLCVCIYINKERVRRCENGEKEEVRKKGLQREAGTITRWPYLASVDNASRRCKWDKQWLSWRLDVAQWWFAVNLTTFVVWPLPSRRCYYESERDERSRGGEKWRC